jgi:hypothetical protein
MHCGIVIVCTPPAAISLSTPHFDPSNPSSAILNQPAASYMLAYVFHSSFHRGSRVNVPPTPLSVTALETFFKYAITGPLCDASITSPEPEVRVWRQVSVALEPAATVITFEVAVVGLGPPLQTMSLEVTSVMGWGMLARPKVVEKEEKEMERMRWTEGYLLHHKKELGHRHLQHHRSDW